MDEELLVRLVARNFLSLGSVDIDLGKLCIFVGRNASGKSNFIKLLRFLELLTRHGFVNEAVRHLGLRSPQDLVFRGRSSENILIRIRARVNGSDYIYELQISPRGAIISESLTLGSRILIKRSGNALEYFTGSSYSKMSISISEKSALYELIDEPSADEAIHRFTSFICSWAFYNFNPVAIRGSSGVGKSEELAYDGSNLPQVLHTLLTTRRKVFGRVEELLKMAVPEVDELLTPVEDGRVRIAIREHGFEDAFEPEQISDGTLRLLAFITALSLPNPIVGFEEPENCVHPNLLEALVEVMRVSGKQVFVTTHSPYLLNYAKPDEVYLVAKVGGETRIRRLTDIEDIEAVRKYLELGGKVGDAWVSGILGSEY